MQIDGPLRSTVVALRGMRPPRFANLFESFVNGVPFQQLSLDAGVSIDVFPPGDVGAARGLPPLLQLDRRKSIDRAVERYGDRRGYLYFCGLGASLLAKGLIRRAAPEQGSRTY